MTESEIDKYRQMAKNYETDKGNMRLYGYTSTSRNRSMAESFAFSNKESGIKKVVFHIHWQCATAHYFMSNGANDHGEEILLMDGIDFSVLSVRDEEYEQYEL